MAMDDDFDYEKYRWVAKDIEEEFRIQDLVENAEPPRRKTNREKALTPKRSLFWCFPCDRQLVGEWKKCPVCGSRNGSRRLKKEPAE